MSNLNSFDEIMKTGLQKLLHDWCSQLDKLALTPNQREVLKNNIEQLEKILKNMKEKL